MANNGNDSSSGTTRLLKLFLAISLVGIGACAPHGTAGIAIRNVTVIDAINGVRDTQTVIFEDDAITYVGPAGSAPATTISIDASGKYLIPGLWDMHVHLTYDERFTDIMPASFLRYGITSVRDTGGLLKNLLPVVEKMRAQDGFSPRVYFSGPLLDGQFVVYDGESAPEIGIQNLTPEQAAENVASLKAAGASFIKIYEMVSSDVFDALVEAANERGMPVAAHVPLALTASAAGPSVRTMEHLRNVELDCASNWEELLATRLELLLNRDAQAGYPLRSSLHGLQRIPAVEALDEERCDFVLASLTDTIQVPTAGLNTILLHPMFERDDWHSALAHLPEDIREDWAHPPTWLPADENDRDTRFGSYTMKMISRMHKAGIPIGAGTDTPIALAIPGYSLLNELELFVKAGLTPLEAIGAATWVPATFFSLQNEMGTVDVGKRADLVLLGSNPLDDINNIRRISAVVARGRIVPD